MKYLMAIYGNEEVWDNFAPDDFERLVKTTDAHNKALFASGELIGAYGVLDQREAKQVHLADGEVIVTDGPYIEAKEYLGSFYIIDCESFERAVEIAAEMPSAAFVPIEIRPLMNEGASDI
jgi:hypothetical protein